MTKLPLAALVAIALTGAPTVAVAQGDPVAEVERTNQFAVENIDLGDWESAKKKLVEALAQLEAYGLGNKPAAARTHMLLGVVNAQGLGDPARGLKHMIRALELAEVVELDPHADDKTKALWAQAQQTVNPTVDCATLEGISHKRVVSTDAGQPVAVKLMLGKSLHGGAVELHYKPSGADAFATLPMTLEGECEFVATIPAAEVKAPSFLYYVVAKTPAGKTAAASGSEARPVLVEVTQKVATEETKREMVRHEEEVPDVLEVPKKGSGCAGCAAGQGGGAGAAVLALGALAWVARRRRAR